jgi:hypothetical protein
MKSKYSKIRIMLGVMGVLACTIGGGVIFYWKYAPSPEALLEYRSIDAPSFIVSVWPRGNISLGSYYDTLDPHIAQPGIGVAIYVLDLIDYEFSGPDPIRNEENLQSYARRKIGQPPEKRVSLYVDGRRVSNIFKKVSPRGGVIVIHEIMTDIYPRYDISWFLLLPVGNHTAKIVIETLDGKTIEYEWEFTVTP